MSIASRIENMYDNVGKAYKNIEDLGIDLTNVDKNLENLSTKIGEIYEELPKVTNEETDEDITLNNTRKGKMVLDLKGNTHQDGEPTPETPQEIHNVSGDNEIKVCNKNLLFFTDKTQTTINGITCKVGNNTFIISGTNTSSSSFALVTYYNSQVQKELNNVFKKRRTFTLSANNNLSGLYFQLNYLKEGSSSQSQLTGLSDFGGKTTFTIPQDFDRLGNIFLGVYGSATSINGSFSLQLEYEDKKTDYVEHKEYTKEINLGDIELCKIGEYKDEFFKNTIDSEYYDSTLLQDKWYLKKRFEKTKLTRNFNWRASTTYKGSFYADITISQTIPYSQLYCTHFIRANISEQGYIPSYYKYGTCFIENKDGQMDFWWNNGATYINNFKNWLDNNDVYITYPLATPKNILLNDTLQETLDSFYSYTGQTNISQTNNDLPFKIKASALKEWKTDSSNLSTLNMNRPTTTTLETTPSETNEEPISLEEE